MKLIPIRILNPNPHPNPNPNTDRIPIMEDSLINPHNLIDLQLKPHAIQSLLASAIDGGDDIEMFALRSMSYTSLKDLMPAASPSSVASPTSGSSWREIPIKDPLVQHAAWAWAYLQPMAEARGEDGRWWRRLRERCGGLWGCFNGVVLVVFRGLFGERGYSDGDGDRVD